MDSNIPPGDVPPSIATPPVIVVQPPSKPRRSIGWMIFAVILFVFLMFSLLGNFAQAISRSLPGGLDHRFKSRALREAGPRLDEVVLKEPDNAHNKIAVITVDGIITSHQTDQAGNSMVDVIRAQLDRAADDNRVKAVILKVDSPGGEVMASDQINKLFARFQSGTGGKPVICSMGSLAASGGYYISAPSRWIVADDLTITASIGVIMHGYNYRGLMDKIGLAPNTYKSGLYKDMLSGDRATNDIPAGERKMVQDLIMETYGTFTNVVATGRNRAYDKNKSEGGKALAADWMDYADGRVVSGKQALKLGLVDELGDFDDAVKRAEHIANGDQKANLIEYRERYDLSDFLSMFGQSGKAHDVKIDLGLDIPKLQAGAMYFLWETPEAK